MPENNDKSQFLTPLNGIFKLLVLSDKQTKTQRYSVNNDIKQSKEQHLFGIFA